MQDFEKLGVFYLGRLIDPSKNVAEGFYLYDSQNLTTHAVTIGMTGSGKTGLCISLLEEAAIDGIPAIAIDPKGDISNILLAFDRLTAEEFIPWVNEDDAKLASLSVPDFAQKLAKSWEEGLAQTGQDRARIKRLKESADFTIYTPGSSAGQEVSVVRSFNCPDQSVIEDNDLLRERIFTATSSLLSLAGVEGDPLRSREHILLSSILTDAWKNGRDLTLPEIIQLVQRPPMTQIGAIDLESFFPGKDRLELAMAINSLIASPGFEAWLTGEPLDVRNLLYTENGKPRVSIFSIAHLSDSERMFFVSLLLNEVVCWMRTQSGTSSLRAILYMDEIFGYFPPVANPPSKRPLITLLKQARAYGLGLVLATQNPVDLDYKGLANAGTWFIGRLQTERDKSRLLEGLEGVAADSGMSFDKSRVDELLSSLRKRVFLVKNVHDSDLAVFETRNTLSYLKGPLSRSQIKSLMSRKKERATVAESALPVEPQPGVILKIPQAPPPAVVNARPAQAASQSAASPYTMPILSPEISQYFLPVQNTGAQSGEQIYIPMLYASGAVRFSDVKASLDATVLKNFLVPFQDGPLALEFGNSFQTKVTVDRLNSGPVEKIAFAPLPQAACLARNYKTWARAFQDFLAAGQKYYLLKSIALKVMSKPEETERDFRIRLSHLAKEKRDETARQLRNKYAPKLQALEDRIRTAEAQVEREKSAVVAHDMQAAISVGATVLGAFLGRRGMSASSLGRATTAARGVERSARKRADVGRAEDNVQAYVERLEEMEREFEDELNRLATKYDATTDLLETVVLAPRKSNITVQLIALVWIPHCKDQQGRWIPAADM